MSLPTSDPRKLMRMSEPERAMIADAVTALAEEHLLDEEQRELAAQIIARMT
jgi:hypothetical protein